MVEIVEITENFIKRNTPGDGRIIYEDGYDKDTHSDEIDTANWIHETFGGDIVLLAESRRQNEEMPDYLWREKYWEKKGIFSEKANTIDLRIRKGYSQIEGRRGGLILDFSGSKLSMDKIDKIIKESLIRRAKGTADILIKYQEMYKVYQATKK